MKLHDPATEREFLRLAAIARAGRKIELGEPREIGAKIRGLLNLAFLLGMAVILLGGPPGNHLADHWRELIACLMLMGIAATEGSKLYQTAATCGTDTVLPNLPIHGEHALRWIRSRYLLDHAWEIAAFCAVVAFTLSGFLEASPVAVARQTVLLLAVTVSTVMLLEDPWLGRLRIPRIWTYLSLLSAATIIGLYFIRRRLFIAGNTPEWMVDVLRGVTWIFPPSWALPGRFEHGGAWLCALWIAWGTWKWMIWPRVAGRDFDTPQDLIGSFGDFAFDDEDMDGDEQWLGPFETDAASEAEPPPRSPGAPITLPPPLTMAAGGWVDRWIAKVVGLPKQHLAGALCDPSATWTRQTRWLIVFSPLWLALTWAFVIWFPESDRKEIVSLWIWILSIAVTTVALLPFTNVIPRAVGMWEIGAQQMPFFAGLPVSTRDLLAVSARITLARCGIMALVAGLFLGLQWMIFEPDGNPRLVPGLVAAIAIFWSLSRPVFVWYRLQTLCRRRRGVWLVHSILQLSCILLALAWLATGVCGVIATGMLCAGDFSKGELGLTLLLAIGCLLASGLCARAVFEIHHWQLRRRHFDWLSMP